MRCIEIELQFTTMFAGVEDQQGTSGGPTRLRGILWNQFR
jgi:hypothetical protein